MVESKAFTPGTPDLNLAYDSKELWGIFQHNKKNTLDYGWIRNRLLRINAKITNDRQNAALDHLVQKDLIEKVSHGRWRYKKADVNGRPSAEVVASAPITQELAAQVVPRFRGAMTDTVYAALREKGTMTTAELTEFLNVAGKDYQNMTSSLVSLERLGWLDVNRSSPRRLKYTARTINKLGDPTRGTLKHNLAPVALPVEPERAVLPAAPPGITSSSGDITVNGQAPGKGRAITALSLEQIRRFADLKEERALLGLEIEEFLAKRQQRLQEIDLELAEYE